MFGAHGSVSGTQVARRALGGCSCELVLYCSYYCHEQEAERENRGVLHVQESLLHAIHARVRNSVYTFRYTPGAMVQGMYVYVCGGLDVAPNLSFCALFDDETNPKRDTISYRGPRMFCRNQWWAKSNALS